MDTLKPRVVVLHNRPDPTDPADVGVLREAEDVDAALCSAGWATERVSVHRGNLFETLTGLTERREDTVVFNLCEGLDGSARFESTVAGLLELFAIRFTGSPSLTLAHALDKRVTKAVLASAGVAAPSSQVFRTVPRPEILANLTYPCVVKPLREDASIGVTRASYVTDPDQLRRQVGEVLERHHQPALVEAYLRGREFNLAVTGQGKGATALPIAEIVFEGYARGEPRLVTHEAKWVEGSEADRRTTPRCPAEVDEPLAARLRALALSAYRVLECRDYARIDVRLDARGRPQVLEVNPNPDIARSAGLARAVAAAGQCYEAFVAGCVEAAWQRG